jgi:hypothetical protein
MELESLLSHAHGLKELILEFVEFDDMSARRVDPTPHEALVVLDSLDVSNLATEAVDAMLSTFTMVNIQHLQSLRVGEDVPLIPLLRVNSQTLQDVQCLRPLNEFSAYNPLS